MTNFKTLSVLNKENPYLVGKQFIEKEELFELINNIIKESPDNNFNWGLVVLKEKLNNG